MTEDTNSVGELFVEVVDWCRRLGVERLNERPGLWHGRTEQTGDIGPLDVRINAHGEEIDHVPPYHALIGMDDFFPGIIALVGPGGGTIIGGAPGEDEAALIEHFKAQGRP